MRWISVSLRAELDLLRHEGTALGVLWLRSALSAGLAALALLGDRDEIFSQTGDLLIDFLDGEKLLYVWVHQVAVCNGHRVAEA